MKDSCSCSLLRIKTCSLRLSHFSDWLNLHLPHWLHTGTVLTDWWCVADCRSTRLPQVRKHKHKVENDSDSCNTVHWFHTAYSLQRVHFGLLLLMCLPLQKLGLKMPPTAVSWQHSEKKCFQQCHQETAQPKHYSHSDAETDCFICHKFKIINERTVLLYRPQEWVLTECLVLHYKWNYDNLGHSSKVTQWPEMTQT